MNEKQYVIFRLGKEEYSVDIEKADEICEFSKITKIPNRIYFLDGIVNLRGEVIPIINLKKRFCVDWEDVIVGTKVLVINILDKKVGFIVDSASEVLSIKKGNVELPPEIGGGIGEQFIIGIGKLENRVLILLDSEKILTNEEKDKLLENIS